MAAVWDAPVEKIYYPGEDRPTYFQAAPVGPPAWIRVWTDHAYPPGRDVMVGPYPDEAAAAVALDSPLIDGLAEENALDVATTTTPPAPGDEQILVDLNDPAHTGRLP